MELMFSKNQRIFQKEHFQLIYRRGRVFNFKNFRVFVLKNNFNKLRASVIVSKKISASAVGRNRIKRKLRHALIYNLPHFPQNLDLLTVATKKEILSTTSSEIKKDFFSMAETLSKSK